MIPIVVNISTSRIMISKMIVVITTVSIIMIEK